MFKKITLLLMISTLVILSTGFVDISTKPNNLMDGIILIVVDAVVFVIIPVTYNVYNRIKGK